MTCTACTQAATEPHSPYFRNGCQGCAARAVSRGQNYHQSKKAGQQTRLYRMELEQFKVTHQQVQDAWHADASNRADVKA